jgi:hypothetical protein
MNVTTSQRIEFLKGMILPFLLAAIAASAVFYFGTLYGYQTRDADLYTRGYQHGQTDIYNVAKVVQTAQQKQIDRQKIETLSRACKK